MLCQEILPVLGRGPMHPCSAPQDCKTRYLYSRCEASIASNALDAALQVEKPRGGRITCGALQSVRPACCNDKCCSDCSCTM